MESKERNKRIKRRTYEFRKNAMALLQGVISPNLFNKENPKPLKLGIIKDIFEYVAKNNLAVSRKTIRESIKLYTSDFYYLKALAKEEFRYDLQGNPCGQVSPEHKKAAKEQLKIRGLKIHKARLKTKRKLRKLAKQRAKSEAATELSTNP